MFQVNAHFKFQIIKNYLIYLCLKKIKKLFLKRKKRKKI